MLCANFVEAKITVLDRMMFNAAFNIFSQPYHGDSLHTEQK